MKNLVYLVFILLSSCSSAKNNETCTTTGVLDKVVWGYTRQDIKKVACFTFIHDNQFYTFREDFHHLMKLNVGDSVLIQYHCHNPNKAKYIKLIKQNDSEQKEEIKFIKIGTGVTCKYYHSVDRKPLFSGIHDYKENDKAVDSYLEKTLKEMNVQEHGKINISIVIDQKGKVIESTVLDSNNQKLNDIVLTILKDMPLWTPAEHKGEKVNVDFLIILEW